MSDSGELFSITAGNQLKINLRKWGQGSMGACVLLHGLADGSYIWGSFARTLKESCRVFAIDLRGHGDSGRDPLQDYSIDAYVQDVASILAQLDLERFVFVGHSLGGDIIGRIAESLPAGNVGIVLVDAGPSENKDSNLLLHDQIVANHRAYQSVKAYEDWLLERWFLASADAIKEVAAQSLRQVGGKYVLKSDPAVANILLQEDCGDWWWSALKKIKVPVLLVRGVGSAFLSRSTASQMLATLANGRMSTIENAGHSVMADNPRGFIEAVAPFVLQCLKKEGGF